MAPLKLLSHLAQPAKQKSYSNATQVASLSGWRTFYMENFSSYILKENPT